MMLSTFSHTYLLYAFKKKHNFCSLTWLALGCLSINFFPLRQRKAGWNKGKDHGNSLVRTQHFHCCDSGSIPGWETKIPQFKRPKKKKKERVSMGSDSNSATGWLFCLGQFITSLGICFVFTKTRKPTTVLSNSRAFVRLKDHVYERTLWRFCKSGEMCIQIICLF